VLKSLGVKKGDRIAIYMGMIPELPIAIAGLREDRAPHSMIFGGFSADSASRAHQRHESEDRHQADGAWRRGAVVPLKASVDEALKETRTIREVTRCRTRGAPRSPRTRRTCSLGATFGGMRPSRTRPTNVLAEPMDARGHAFHFVHERDDRKNRRGIVHTTAGYLLEPVTTHRYVFDLKERGRLWCTADIGWVTGHSNIGLRSLANGCTHCALRRLA